MTLKHTTWERKYHVVFIPKCRCKALSERLQRDLRLVFRGLAEQKECKVEEGHLKPDQFDQFRDSLSELEYYNTRRAWRRDFAASQQGK
jgi:hypothetical protein